VPCAGYLQYSLSLRDVEELLAERGLEADHTTIWLGCNDTVPNWNSDCGVILSRPTNPVAFPAKVATHPLCAYGWPPEQVRALGLAINPGEDVAWPITREFVSIKHRQGNVRTFYRLSS